MFVGTETNTQSHCATHAFSQIEAHLKAYKPTFVTQNKRH
jgi:hypothetical protein